MQDISRHLSLVNCEHAVVVIVGVHLFQNLLKTNPRKLLKKVFTSVVDLLGSAIPAVGNTLAAEKTKALDDIERDMLGDGDPNANIVVPSSGVSVSEIRLMAEKLKTTHSGFASGKKWGGIYHEAGSEATKLQSEIWGMFNSTNTLYPGVFPAIRKFEAELIQMVCSMVGKGTCGLLASGGTESILLAALSYRETARSRNISYPNIICCETAHPAIFKACKYFSIELIKAPFDPSNFRLTPKTVAPFVNKNTVAVYASAPTFPHGVLDDVEGLGKFCQSKGIGLHVDNCLGGFLLSYLKKQDLLKGRKFDFDDVPGVTTMSVDLHKYGGTNKGCSVCVFRTEELRNSTYMPSFDGCEGLYVTPTLQGSRSGATIAAAWSSVLYKGENGYLRMAKSHNDTMTKAKGIINKIDGLDLLVEPEGCILPLVPSPGSKLDIYLVASQMEKKGWNLFTGQSPAVLGLCVGDVHLKMLDAWEKDLMDAVTHVKANPKEKAIGNAAVYGAASTIPDTLLDSILRQYVNISLRVKEKQ